MILPSFRRIEISNLSSGFMEGLSARRMSFSQFAASRIGTWTVCHCSTDCRRHGGPSCSICPRCDVGTSEWDLAGARLSPLASGSLWLPLSRESRYHFFAAAMLFNSAQFIFVFLPIVLSVFFLLGRLREQMLAVMWLVAASLVFYGFDDPYRLLPLILGSIAFNFFVGRMLLRSQNRALLAIGIGGDLLLLGYFKYAGFLVETLNAVTGIALPKPNIDLPIGISFFTFTQIAFLVDAYRGEAREYEPFHYTLFVSFFPHLIAGPIYHHKEIMPQFHLQENFRFGISNFGLGLTWFALGLAKKILFADVVAQYATPIFNAAAAGQAVGLVDSWIGACGFGLQLYYDFSGYSDMAIGLALMIGVRLPLNFDSPYKALSLIDFWRRWHMTLSRFLRDYLYIPLGGNRKGPRRRYINLLVTMLLGGLWHGAAWTFVIWGAIHGFGLVVNHAWNKVAESYRLSLPNPVAWRSPSSS